MESIKAKGLKIVDFGGLGKQITPPYFDILLISEQNRFGSGTCSAT
jgi:hypothetical protein